jgi:phage shock protein PspC (stress-responsive transcriptional regulator)
MKKIININLSGRVIPIEDSAYESLQRYIESLRRYFANEEGRDEIINDIESRIAELMNDKVRKGTDAITDADVTEIIASMGSIEDFEEMAADDNQGTTSGSTNNTGQANSSYTYTARGRMYRDSTDKLLGGVCAGIANYMNVDPAMVRLLFAIITFGGFGAGILIYVLLWIILPMRSLETFEGKRLFRNPEDRVIAGVAGGLGAYFNKPATMFRIIFAAPILLNVLFGLLNGLFFFWDHELFPNIFITSFTSTFVVSYIILWIVLPEARSAFEKMEMRGEKVDVNRIRQNVKEGMSDFKTRMESWGEEVKASAQELSQKASAFAQTRGNTFASEVRSTARPLTSSIGHVIGVLFKAFFLFFAGCIALGLFAGLLTLIFGGVAFWPVNNYLWTSSIQRLLAWGTLIFFFAVPLIAFMTWLIRRIVRVRSRNRYLGWTFGGLWTIGWICAICFAASISKDVRVYDKTTANINLVQPASGKLILQVNEPEVRYSGNIWWLNADNTGLEVSDHSIKYNNVKMRMEKSADSLFHVQVYKYSFGRNAGDAQSRASRTIFNIKVSDSVVSMASGLTIDESAKFRGQGVIVEVQVPVGKMIRFDESVSQAYSPWVVRTSERSYHRWNRSIQYDWDYDSHFEWEPGIDYVMNEDGNLERKDKPEKKKRDELKSSKTDSLRRSIELQEEKLQHQKDSLEEVDRQDLGIRQPPSTKTKPLRHLQPLCSCLSPY